MLFGLSAAFPAALALTALVPLLWWLHRGRPRGDPLQVSSLALFRAAKPRAEPREPESIPQTDPAWIRRGLIVLALAAALAGVQRASRELPIVVWIDGSASLETREHGEPRLRLALAALDRELAAHGAARVTVHALSRPDFVRHLSVPFDAPALAAQLPVGAPIPPDAAELDPAAQQWLVTDGANEGLVHWLSGAPMDHVVAVGSLSENAAVVLVAYRTSLRSTAQGDVLVSVYNAGRAAVQRRLELLAAPIARTGAPAAAQSAAPVAGLPSASLGSLDLVLQPGETRTASFTTGAPPFRLEARLSPADALPDDDTLAVDVPRPLAARVAVDPACPPPLGDAVDADPAVTRASPQGAELLVDCSDRWPESRVPRLTLRRLVNTRLLAEIPRWRWSRAAPAFQSFPRGMRAGSEPLSLSSGDELVVSDGARPLAVVHPHPVRTLETVLDLEDDRLAARAEYPLIVASLLDAAAGEALLERVASASRSPQDARIAPDAAAIPRWRHARPSLARPAPSSSRSDGTPAALAIAVLLLAWEAAAAARAVWMRYGDYSGASP